MPGTTARANLTELKIQRRPRWSKKSHSAEGNGQPDPDLVEVAVVMIRGGVIESARSWLDTRWAWTSPSCAAWSTAGPASQQSTR